MKSKQSTLTVREIAVCGLSAACAAIILALGYFLTFGEFFWYFCASLPLNLPRSTAGKFACYAVAALFGLLLCSFNFVYLAAFLTMIGPYPAAASLVRKCPVALQHVLLSVCFFLGALAVLWFTPMFFVQLNTVSSTGLRIAVAVVAAAVSFPVEYGYSRLFRLADGHLTKRSLFTA